MTDDEWEAEQQAVEERFAALRELGFDVRAANCFARYNLATLEDIAAKTERQLLAMEYFGRKSLNMTKEILASHGMRLSNGSPVSPEARLATIYARISGHLRAVAELKADAGEIEREMHGDT